MSSAPARSISVAYTSYVFFGCGGLPFPKGMVNSPAVSRVRENRFARKLTL
jgi:hypothetical protein